MITYNGITLGRLLDEDALFLQSVIKMTTPKTLVEFGYLHGDSARSMLQAMDEEAHLYSFDNTANGNIQDSRFTFHHLSQAEFDTTDITNVDFVFLDASHDLLLNKQTFTQLLPRLSAKAIIAIHDTGTWCDGNVFEFELGEMQKDGTYAHCPDEIAFMNWLYETYPQWQQIHFHSSRKVRHGITLIQKYTKL